MIFKIALKNLSEHKVKSFIVGGLIALGMFLLVLTISIQETSSRGIEQSFIESFSGHALVGLKGKDGALPSIFPGAGFGPSVDAEAIPDFDKVYKDLKNQDFVQNINPQVFGAFRLDVGDTWFDFQGLSFGFNMDSYAAMFPNNMNIIEGELPSETNPGILISKAVKERFMKAAIKDIRDGLKARLPKELADKSDDEIVDMVLANKVQLTQAETDAIGYATIRVGEKVKLTSYSAGSRIKSLKVTGIYEFKSNSSSIESVSIMDLSSLRYLAGLVVGSAKASKVDEKTLSEIEKASQSEDSFFGDEGIISKVNPETTLSQADYEKILANNEVTKELNKADEGAWHYILLRFKPGVDVNQSIASLNAYLEKNHPKLVAVDWKAASGIVSQVSLTIQLIFIILISLIVVVCLIIIVNTMVASVIERTAEIGTMRALGAQRGFVRRIIGVESMLTSVGGALCGLFFALVVIGISNTTGISMNNEFLKAAFGMKIIYPSVSLGSLATALLIIVGLGVLSSAYPTALATKVSPLKAMQS